MSYMYQIALGPTDPIWLVHTIWGPNCHKSIICQRDAIDCGNEGTQTWKLFSCRVVGTGYWQKNNPDSTLGVIWVISSKLPLDPCTREAIFILIAYDGNTDFTHISVFIFQSTQPVAIKIFYWPHGKCWMLTKKAIHINGYVYIYKYYIPIHIYMCVYVSLGLGRLMVALQF